jgi:electron transfer flavoprotein beta subunit
VKILVTVKRVTDYEAKLKIKSSADAVETDGVNMIANPFDEIAVEEALRLKDKHGGEVCVVSIGSTDASQQIRSALAMGADRGILVLADQQLDCFAVSKVLEKVAQQESPDVILLGKQAIDDDSHQVAEMLAERLGYGQATQANKVSIEGNVATVIREADGGLETLSVGLPCVITADLRLNEPRYASLPGIMKAKKKPLDEKKIEDFGLDLSPKVSVKRLELPPKKQAGQMVPDVATLLSKLRTEAKVL